jgi:hypothetical protein
VRHLARDRCEHEDRATHAGDHVVAHAATDLLLVLSRARRVDPRALGLGALLRALRTACRPCVLLSSTPPGDVVSEHIVAGVGGPH